MLAIAPRLAGLLSESDLTLRYATFALQTVPLACFLGAPFLLCRPVFEAMQRGRPGLVMALIRYVALTGPLAWLGMAAAQRLGQPPLNGLIVGTLAAGAISSAGFYLWLRSALRSIVSMSASAASQSSTALSPRNPRRRARW
jgi:Na+-driven multidrug efflux pump